MKRVSVTYMGRVQGVGFRYTVLEVAGNFRVNGYVRNESDGTVSLVAEGDEPEIKRFLHAVRSSPVGGYIAHEDARWTAATGEFKGFTIRYGL